jgi:hypothetical protein
MSANLIRQILSPQEMRTEESESGDRREKEGKK